MSHRNGNPVVSALITNSFTPHTCLTASQMDEHRTMYFSTSTLLSDERTLLTILQQSRHDNAAAGISGILLYVRGSIVQVLEGEAQAVEALFRRIEVDKRHTDVVRVLDQPITQRLFADWAMGYETVTHRQMETIRASVVLDQHHNAMITIEPNEHIILRLIKVFYETNRHN